MVEIMQNECWWDQICVTRIFFGQLRGFLSKPVNQVQFNKTIIFLRVSRLQAYFQDIGHVFLYHKALFHTKKHKKEKLLKNMQNECWSDQFCVMRIFLVD